MADKNSIPTTPKKTADKSMFKDSGEKYHWVYELPMMKTFLILFEVWKVLGIAAGLVVVLMAVINLASGDGLKGLAASLGIGILVLAILMILSLPAYYLVTKANNGKYTVLFEMDKEGIDHVQIKTDKASALEALTVFIGSAAGSHAAMGSGLMSSAGGSLYTRFSNVRKIKAIQEKGLIVLYGKLTKNHIYTTPADFGFVYGYIKEHCPEAKIV